MSRSELKEALTQVGANIDKARRDALAQAFQDPHTEKRVETAAMLLKKFEPLRAKVSPATWENIVTQLDYASGSMDVDPLMAALDAADAEIRGKGA